MVNSVHQRFNAADRSYFAILKKEIHALAAEAIFSKKRLAEIDIVVAEIVSNLSKHASGGEVFVKLIEENSIQGIEILAIDHGPGISDLKGMMLDGASTKNTLGHGLGAIKRLTDVFQIYTQKGWGTLLLCRIYNKDPKLAKSKQQIDIHSLVVPKPGETACGDGFCAVQTKEHLKLLLGDGLGHGKEAAIAVNKAIEAFKQCDETSAVENLRFINQEVKKTRGLVATIAIFSFAEQQWKICGVGNIATKMYGASTYKNHSPYNGIVGLNMPKTMNDQAIPYDLSQIIIMCSDGIRSKWDTLKFPGITRQDLTLLNAAIFKDFARNTDDMSVASCKLKL